MLRIAPDGSFRIVDCRKESLVSISNSIHLQRGWALARVERDGIEHKEGIEVGFWMKRFTGVKLIFTYGTRRD
jgi:hypothetical protein